MSPDPTAGTAAQDAARADEGNADAWRPGRGQVGILRLGHRPGRDKRITTHVCLTARALGADAVYVHEPDERIVDSVRSVVERFGGPFAVHAVSSWRNVITEWAARGATIVHLTMYGIDVGTAIARLDADRDVLVVLGAEKVPFDLYEMADLNVAVGNQPHSEVAALAVLLDRFTQGKWAQKPFSGKVRVVPSERAKSVSSGDAP